MTSEQICNCFKIIVHILYYTDCLDINQEFKKQMIWFHKNYMKTERENQMLWINSQISHLNNLKKYDFSLWFS